MRHSGWGVNGAGHESAMHMCGSAILVQVVSTLPMKLAQWQLHAVRQPAVNLHSFSLDWAQGWSEKHFRPCPFSCS